MIYTLSWFTVNQKPSAPAHEHHLDKLFCLFQEKGWEDG